MLFSMEPSTLMTGVNNVGDTTGFSPVQDHGAWTVAPLAYTGTPDASGTAAISICSSEYSSYRHFVRHSPSGYDLGQELIETSITVANNTHGGGEGFVVFDYVDANNFKFAGLDTGTDQWIIGACDASVWHYYVQQSAGTDLVPGKTYEVSVASYYSDYDSSRIATLTIDGSVAATYSYAPDIDPETQSIDYYKEYYAGLGSLDGTATFGFFNIGAALGEHWSSTGTDWGCTDFATAFGGAQALGVTADHRAYLPVEQPDGHGSYAKGTLGEWVGSSTPNGFYHPSTDPTIWSDYVQLAWQTGGSVWDIGMLRGTNTRTYIPESFSTAFVDAFADQLVLKQANHSG